MGCGIYRNVRCFSVCEQAGRQDGGGGAGGGLEGEEGEEKPGVGLLLPDSGGQCHKE